MRSILVRWVPSFIFVIFLIPVTECRAQDVVTKPHDGQFCLFRSDDRFFLRVADSLLGRDILIVSRIVDTWENVSADLLNARGAKTIEQVMRFVKGRNNKIALELICYDRHRTAHAQIALARNCIGSIITVTEFDILSDLSKDGISVIDISALINIDNDIIYLMNSTRNRLRLNKISNSIFKVTAIQVNPGSIEIRTSRLSNNKLILDLNTSLLILPRNPMRARYADSRLNYFEQKSTQFEPGGAMTQPREMITRWRLEPKAQDKVYYEKGLLVEPEKPLVFYIDTAMPEKWIPWFIQGVSDWQKAFEKAGFKNAILAKRVPKDSLFILNDIRYSVIKYNSLKIDDATYSYVVDPRSGEIVQANIIWNQGAADGFVNRYIVLVSSSDKSTRIPTQSDSIKGDIIRYFIQHEIGHSLGFDHNMMASNSVPVNKLRDKKWVELNGFSASIMDYCRFNYVAMPADKVTARKGLINEIGPYDEWAIEWGYSVFPADILDSAEKKLLEKWIMQKASSKKFRDGGPFNDADPRSQSEDLGDDPVLAGIYGMKNLQFTMRKLANWANDSSYDKSTIAGIYLQVTQEYNWFISHAVTNLTGAYFSTYLSGEPTVTPVPAHTRKKSLDFIQSQLFIKPAWLINQTVINRTGLSETYILNRIHTRFLIESLSLRTLSRIQQRESNNFKYTLSRYLRDMSQRLFEDLHIANINKKHIQVLQQGYIKYLVSLIPTTNIIDTSSNQIKVSEKVRVELMILRDEIRKSVDKMKDDSSIKYLRELLDLINKL